MTEIIQSIMDTVDKKKVQTYCKKILKKCSFQSSVDMQNLARTAEWLYVYQYYDEAVGVCDIVKNLKFTGDYTLWEKVDTLHCFKARILRERGEIHEARQIIDFVNQYRHPHLYPNLVEWFQDTLDLNIKNAIEQFHSKAREISWREIKLAEAVKYREAGEFPITGEKLEEIIGEQIEILKKA